MKHILLIMMLVSAQANSIYSPKYIYIEIDTIKIKVYYSGVIDSANFSHWGYNEKNKTLYQPDTFLNRYIK